ncbi:MAG: translation elongation factor Ts [Aquificaceae bacterium]
MDSQTIKTLREMTGAGILECKKALEEASGDIQKAKEILRVRGLAKADKKAGRETREGAIFSIISENRKSGVIIELNCETDFVAKNEQFTELAKKICKAILDATQIPQSLEEVMNLSYNSSTVGEAIKSAIAIIGENINLRRFSRFDTEGFIHSYIHGIGKVGVMIELNGEPDQSSIQIAQNIGMQIAAMKPEFVSVETIDPEVLNSERRILTEQAKQEGKPDNVIEKVVEGRLKKFYQEKVLLEQPYIKDEKLSVKDYIKSVNPSFRVLRFVRFEVGSA